MKNFKTKIYTIMFCLISSGIGHAQYMTEIRHTALQDVNVNNSTVTIDNQVYKYKVNTTKSQYSDSEIKPLTLQSLFKDRLYYFEVEQDSDKQNSVVYIADEKLPE